MRLYIFLAIGAVVTVQNAQHLVYYTYSFVTTRSVHAYTHFGNIWLEHETRNFLQRFNKLMSNLVPFVLLGLVVLASFRLVHSNDSSRSAARSENDSVIASAERSGETAVMPAPIVMPQGLVSEEKSASASKADEVPNDEARQLVGAAKQTVFGEDESIGDGFDRNGSGSKASGSADSSEKVWREINDAITGLNDLVGAEMFIDIRRKQKGQMEIRLDNSLWKRVRYQTRVDIKTDISNLWNLYVKEYGYAGSSVVYFMDDSNGRVIDIFSKAN